MKGGKLSLKMGKMPNKSWALDEKDRPHSEVGDNLIQPVPFMKAQSITFKDSLQVELATPFNNAKNLLYS